MDRIGFHILLAITAWLAVTAICLAEKKLPAFPGAEGFGASTPGGRGGDVLLVTTLEDYVPGKDKQLAGSLRSAIAAKRPRIVVFRVSGTIALKAPLRISEPYLTLAGQSAPGDGICIKNYGLSVRTHDVVLRHLRVRPGDELGSEFKSRGKSFAPDGISVESPSRNVVIGHCSVSWAIDDLIDPSASGCSVTLDSVRRSFAITCRSALRIDKRSPINSIAG